MSDKGSWALSKQDSSALKGIAIIAMLFHHLYFSIPGWVEPYNGVLLWLGWLGKVCVSIFLFCSGYGLSVQYEKVSGVKGVVKFLRNRFFSFYVNYWAVFLLFVPITVFVFNRPLSVPYGENVNYFKMIVLDLLGLQGFQSYNITWWFNKLIIILYFLFPVLYWCANRRCILTLLLSVLILRFWMSVFNYDFYGELYSCQAPFIFGIVYQKWSNISLKDVKNKSQFLAFMIKVQRFFLAHKFLFGIVSVLVLLCVVFLRMNSIIPHWSGIRLDAFLTLAMVLFVVAVLRYHSFLMNILSFIGKHSINIYLIHTFFNSYWNLKWLHEGLLMRSGMNLIVLFSMSMGASLIIEWLKKKSGVYGMVDYVKTKLP